MKAFNLRKRKGNGGVVVLNMLGFMVERPGFRIPPLPLPGWPWHAVSSGKHFIHSDLRGRAIYR